MFISHYECDQCGSRDRRITLHIAGRMGFQSEMHFCSTQCMDAQVESIDYGGTIRCWLKGRSNA